MVMLLCIFKTLLPKESWKPLGCESPRGTGAARANTVMAVCQGGACPVRGVLRRGCSYRGRSPCPAMGHPAQGTLGSHPWAWSIPQGCCQRRGLGKHQNPFENAPARSD